ncbi:hypothetical protein [Enterobacter sp. Bisph1]|uniref:hypothetical protein n=1 Tax=Enterobacter sp. Bisph1 TaxID=1274399 RepID=UPI00057BF287|nr:hypothetical protein [Enterobacter sp. Bisph1]
MNNFNCAALLSLMCIAFHPWAATSPVTPSASLYWYQDTGPFAADTPHKENQQPSSFSALPFYGDEARARGYDLPAPFGININYMNMRQNIAVDSIAFSGLALGSIPLDNLFKINVGDTRESSETETLRLDAWIFPFMNVYGLVGHTEGHSVSDIGVGVKLGNLGEIRPDNLQNLKFRLDFKGTTYGAGTTLAGGVGNWFALVDANYTQTRFDILDGSIDAFTFTPRLGYRFTTPGMDTLHLPAGKLNVWVGSMYQDVQQEFKGRLSDLSMPSTGLQEMVNMANSKGKGRFDVKQHLQSPWNMLIGAQYVITRDFNVTTEVGFATRNSFFVAGEYRF